MLPLARKNMNQLKVKFEEYLSAIYVLSAFFKVIAKVSNRLKFIL